MFEFYLFIIIIIIIIMNFFYCCRQHFNFTNSNLGLHL